MNGRAFLCRLCLLAAAATAACQRPSTAGSTPEPSHAAPPPLDEAPPAESPEAMLAAFLDGYVERFPVTATGLGRHEFDDRWPDLSAAGRGSQLEWTRGMAGRIAATREAAIASGTADPNVLLDLDIAAGELALIELSAAEERPWSSDPLAYATLIGAGLDPLIARPFAPVEVRARSLAGRLEGLPALCEQAEANLSEPRRIKLPSAEVGLAQLAALDGLLDRDVREMLAGVEGTVADRGRAAIEPARAAVAELHAHVQRTVDRRLDRSDENWRLGRATFERKLALTLGTDRAASEIHDEAIRAHARVREQMAALADELWPVLFAAAPPADPDARTRAVLEALARVHVQPDELRDAAAENLERLRTFVTQHGLVPMQGAPPLDVVWTPPHQQGVAIAGLEAPPALDDASALASTYLVQPVPATWPPERRESFLREYNHFMLEILSIHEAIPGHYVQLWYGATKGQPAPSVVRRAFQNGAFVEGWAVYGERVMVEAGYAGAPLPAKFRRPRDLDRRTYRGLQRVLADDDLRAKAIALHRLKFYLRTVTNAILDYELHAGDMTRDQAMALMTERSFQQEGEAAAKWVRAQITSTQLSTYFVGATGWFRLREAAEAEAAAAGRPFDAVAQGRFHAEALSHGAPPLHRLAELMHHTASSP